MRGHARHSYTAVYHLGGAVGDVDLEATAYSHRHAAHAGMILGAAPPQQPLRDAETEWARRFFTALPLALAARYDPGNIFRRNRHIPPVDGGAALSGTPK